MEPVALSDRPEAFIDHSAYVDLRCSAHQPRLSVRHRAGIATEFVGLFPFIESDREAVDLLHRQKLW